MSNKIVIQSWRSASEMPGGSYEINYTKVTENLKKNLYIYWFFKKVKKWEMVKKKKVQVVYVRGCLLVYHSLQGVNG